MVLVRGRRGDKGRKILRKKAGNRGSGREDKRRKKGKILIGGLGRRGVKIGGKTERKRKKGIGVGEGESLGEITKK